MDLRDGDRGQAIQLGAVLLFGILIVALALYQATVIPQENKGVEYESYLDTTTDMTELRSGVLVSSTQGYQTSTTVETGTTYPSRVLFVNPGPAMGRLSTTSNGSITFSNAEAVPMEAVNTKLVWDGSSRTYTTKSGVFSPNYNELQAPPVVVSPFATYRATDNGPVSLTGQTLIVSNRITVYTIAGDVSRTALTTTVTTEPVSVASNTVTISGNDSDGDGTREDFNMTFTTVANATKWNETTLATNIRRNPNVESVTAVDNNTISVRFDGTRSYRLRIARVELREEGDAETVPSPGPKYIIDEAGPGGPINSSYTVDLTAEVRDRYNNPVAGAKVTFTASSGQFLANGQQTLNVTTTEDGHATVTYYPETDGTKNITAKIDTDGDGDDSKTWETTNWTVQAT